MNGFPHPAEMKLSVSRKLWKTNLKLLSCLDNTAVKLDKCNFIPLALIKNL